MRASILPPRAKPGNARAAPRKTMPPGRLPLRRSRSVARTPNALHDAPRARSDAGPLVNRRLQHAPRALARGDRSQLRPARPPGASSSAAQCRAPHARRARRSCPLLRGRGDGALALVRLRRAAPVPPAAAVVPVETGGGPTVEDAAVGVAPVLAGRTPVSAGRPKNK